MLSPISIYNSDRPEFHTEKHINLCNDNCQIKNGAFRLEKRLMSVFEAPGFSGFHI